MNTVFFFEQTELRISQGYIEAIEYCALIEMVR